METLKLCYWQCKERYQMINIIMILILRIKMDIQFVIIYLTMILKYQNIGKIININILWQIDIKKLNLCYNLIINKYQINGIITILEYKINKDIQLPCYYLHMVLLHLKDGNMIQKFIILINILLHYF